jgi:Integrase core domain.
VKIYCGKWKWTYQKVSWIRCDRGDEYVGNAATEWCERKGIKIDYSIPHTPQLNGKAKRHNRKIINKARALLYDSEVSLEVWGEAVYTTTYVINRSPTRKQAVTPAELWHGKKPDLSRLQIFGTKTYALNLWYLKKLQKRIKPYVFVGYATNDYRLYDEETKNTIIAKDVEFEKKITKEDNI